MARSDLLLNLVKASVDGDTGTVRRTVDAIVAEERAKHHNVLADQIERVAQSAKAVNGVHGALRQITDSGTRARDYLSEITPRRRLEEITLPEITRRAVGQLVEEQQRADLLRSHSLEPRHRLLLVGPPGNGKTTLAEGIAEALAVPFFTVRYEGMIGSFLGETAARLKRVFEYARTVPCVLFFDEFDAVGKERGDKHETGEIKRVVTSLLMQVDELPSYVVVIAATNHAELLDRAVWRRFQLRLSLPAPSIKQLSEFIGVLSDRAQFKLGLPASAITKALGRVSYSEAEEFFLDVLRRSVLSVGERSSSEIVREQLKIWAARARNSRGARDDAGSTAT